MSERDQIPVSAQLAVVNKIVLPLLEKMNINVTVTTKPEGLALDLRFREPKVTDTGVPEGQTLGTETPEMARTLWALREKIEDYRRTHPDLPVPDAI
jgi:hypothetical protein